MKISKSSRRRNRKKDMSRYLSGPHITLNPKKYYYLWSDSLQWYYKDNILSNVIDNRLVSPNRILNFFSLRRVGNIYYSKFWSKAKDWRVLKKPIYKEKSTYIEKR